LSHTIDLYTQDERSPTSARNTYYNVQEVSTMGD